MDQERIKAELEARHTPGAVVGRLNGLKQLASLIVGGGVPTQLRPLVEQAFTGHPASRVHLVSRQRGRVGERLKELSAAEWSRSIATLVPRVAPSAESALQALVRRPYQDGFGRRPFRCPRSRTTLADLRGRWLLTMALLVGDYDADIVWVAEHAAHLAGWSGGTDLGWLLAGAIDVGDASAQRVYDILVASASGEHETAQMGRHVTQALMSCARPEAWAFVEKLLLAAQRQEGLRQAILESVDESHPQAFRRMLRLILDENLARFSSVVRAADTWFGFMWDGASGVAVNSILERVLLFLDDPAARTAALAESDGETVYLALWSTAFDDVDAAIAPAASLLSAPSAEVRFAATHFLVEAGWNTAIPPLVDVVADEDLRVAARALDMFAGDCTKTVDGERLFRNLEQLLDRVPRRAVTLDAIVWPWWKRKLERPAVAAALAANASAVPAERLLPHIPELDPTGRAAFLRNAAGLGARYARADQRPAKRTMSPAERAIAIDLLGDSSADVRGVAFQALRELPLLDDEEKRLIELLGRKPGDLRSGALARLRTLPDERLLAAADALLADPLDLRRQAGLELLRDMSESKRSLAPVRERIARYTAAHVEINDQERAHVSAVLAGGTETATTNDAFGLLEREALRGWPEPRRRDVDIDSRAARASVESLAALVLEKCETEVRTEAGEIALLTQSAYRGFGPQKREDLDAGDATVPLAPVWKQWLAGRDSALRDADGNELLRAVLSATDGPAWKSGAAQQVCGIGKFSAGGRFLVSLLGWCAAWDPPRDGFGLLLDALEDAIAELTADDYREIAEAGTEGHQLLWGGFGEKEAPFRTRLKRAESRLSRVRWWRTLFPAGVQPAQAERLYGLLRWFEARTQGCGVLRVSVDDFVGAYAAGAAGEAEWIDLLVGRWSERPQSLLRHVSGRKPPRALVEHPELLALVDRCRRRIVEVETQRGDRRTAASRLTMELRLTGGLETVSRAVAALGKTHFARSFGWIETGASRQETLSHLVVRSLPREEDTPEAFARWVREGRIGEARLVELAVYAPQWAGHVNHVLQWPGLESAVWWIQAHTKDDRSWRLQEMKEVWAAEVSERTPLSAADLTEGAVDVGWFASAYESLGATRWKMLDAAAKYAASSTGHTRAQVFARAMAGLVTRDEIVGRVDEKRHQDSVRALGLLPIAAGDAGERDLLERYLRLERFRREARKFGAQRQQSEARAAAIGLANLARTAGFRDPQRLQWAMEQKAVADLAKGPLVLTRDDVRLELSVDVDGSPSLGISRAGKPLKALPAALKKDAEIAELKHRLQELKRQHSRVRDALEEAMCRGDRFAPAELRTLLQHPILAPALARLVFVGDGVAGYLSQAGRTLRDHAGVEHVLGTGEDVRIAHPHDLFTRGDWAAWQHECFRAERVQPFKQLFRELYPITDGERGTRRSRRYAGHQVNPRQALALLGGRGWVARPEEGVSRTFHEAGITARLGFQEAFFTPAEIEGLTLEEVIFTPKGEWTELPLDDVPARLFAEAMRDLDLVVSVAHRGGVDPEATASTVEMRAALVTQTCELLGLENVEVQPHHAIVRGELATYSVHLGSAGVMLLPGTALPIVAVHSQHRGRLFLPFADDDPRTAEVLSKVLLLARDRQIRDPGILAWIRAGKSGLE